MDATTVAVGQSAQRTLVEDVNGSAELVAEKTEEPATGSVDKSRPSYFTRAAVPLWIGILAGMTLVVLTGILLFKRLQRGRALEVDEASPVARMPSGSIGLSAPNRISTTGSQPVATGPLSGQEISGRQAGAEAAFKEDAIASMIANLVRKGAHPS
jgi:xanthine/uracil permease